MKKNKILLTGGHAGTTALAVIEEIEKRGIWKKIAWIGNKRAIENADIQTIESKLFRDLELDYYEIDSGRFQRRWSPKTVSALLKIPFSFFHSYKLVSEIKPQLVLSFGGATSVPVVISSWLMGIPVIIHEQTIAVGLANKIASVFADKIALARVESAQYFNNKKTIHVGNPINSQLRNLKRDLNKSKKPLLYITGGSRGSQRINNVIFESIKNLSKTYKTIHQTGDLDIEKAEKLSDVNYEPHAFIHPKELKKILQEANIVISRSGANTVAELIAFSIPSILIPIPWTRYDEQTKNAKLAQQAGVSILMTESEMNHDNLIKNLNKIHKNYSNYSEAKKLKTTSKDLNAHENLVNLMEEILQ